MKVTRSYWLGLGSGLILSAMLVLVISPQRGQAVMAQKSSSVPPVNQQVITQSLTGETKKVDSPSAAQPSVSTQLSQGRSPDASSTTNSPTQTEQNNSISK